MKNNKLVLFTAVSVLALAIFTGCGYSKEPAAGKTPAETKAAITETTAAETTAAETTATETAAPETTAAETAAPETMAAETEAVVPETVAETVAAEETTAAETTAVETAAPETTAAETEAVVPETVAETVAAEETTAVETAAVETVAPETLAAKPSSIQQTFPDPASAAITEEQAVEIALEHAGLKKTEVIFAQTELHYQHGRMDYDIEFYTRDKEYDYEIDAQTGEILGFDMDIEQHYSNPGQTVPASVPGTASGAAPAVFENLTQEQALQIALEHAGVAEKDIYLQKAKQDYEHGRQIYELKFYVGRTEYEYEIDAKDGQVLKYDIDLN